MNYENKNIKKKYNFSYHKIKKSTLKHTFFLRGGEQPKKFIENLKIYKKKKLTKYGEIYLLF